jgi:ATP-dependent RNA helicase SUPV3L1/SUV3
VPLSGSAKGLAFMLFEALGTLSTPAAAQQLKDLSDTDKPRLARLGLRFGVEAIYLPDLLKPAQISLRALLWNLHNSTPGAFHASPPAGRVAIDAVEGVPDEFWLAIGYRRLGGRVMRVDMVERVAFLVRNAAREGKFRINEDMLSLAGATRDQMAAMLVDMNCKIVGEEPDEDPEKPAIQIFERLRRQRPSSGANRVTHKSAGPNSADQSKDQKSGEQRRDGGRRSGKFEGKSANKSASKSASKSGGKPAGRKPADRPTSFSAKSSEPDPQSPFAVLAALKLKS